MAAPTIPEDFPISYLVGQELTQVCIGSHHLRLNFHQRKTSSSAGPRWEEGASIDIEAGFYFSEVAAVSCVANNSNLASQAGCLTVLLGQQATSVVRLEKNELLIAFSGGAKLQLRTDASGYESYHLHICGQSIDV